MRIASKNDREKSKGTGTHLNAEEIKKAERFWILEAQKQIDEKCWKQVEKLSPFKDEEGVIRMNGRIKNVQMFDENRKHPVLLPKKHRVSQLIVEQFHNECIHPGHLRVIAEER